MALYSEHPYDIYWRNSIKINNSDGFTLAGYSRAAENSGFYVKELKLVFDAGIQINTKPKFICLTHLHLDHVCKLAQMLIGNRNDPIIFIPNNDAFELLLTSMLQSIFIASKFFHPESLRSRSKTTFGYKLVRLNIGDIYKIKGSDKDETGYYIEGLPAEHGVVAISFGLFLLTKRCKPEYQGLTKNDYRRMTAENIQFTEQYRKPIICYMSDTNYKPLINQQSQLILKYPLIVIECTFLESDDLSHANKKKHIHWSQLEPIVRTHSDIKFILIHFSQKYSSNEIRKFFDEHFKNVGILTNVVLWLQSGIVDYSTTDIESKLQSNNINHFIKTKTKSKLQSDDINHSIIESKLQVGIVGRCWY